MRKLVLKVTAGPCMNSAEAYLVPKSITQAELDDYAWERAVEFAEMYGLEPRDWAPEDEEDDFDSYSDDIEGWFEEYDAKKHDNILIYGANSTFEWNEY